EQAYRDVTIAAAEGLEAQARDLEKSAPGSPEIPKLRGCAEAVRKQLPIKFWTPEMHRDNLLATTKDPQARAEISRLSAADLAKIYPDSAVPNTFRFLAEVPGFGDYAKQNPAEARTLADAAAIFPGLRENLAQRVQAGGEAG